MVALSLIEEGKKDEAVAAADRAITVAHNPVIRAQLADVYARAGMKDKARMILSGLEAQVRHWYVCGLNVACVYSGWGEKEEAHT